MWCRWNFFNGSIYKKIASYRYHAGGICKTQPCPDPGEGRWRLCSGPGSVSLRGPCWLQWRLKQLREVWKGAGRRLWALHGRTLSVARRRHQELPEWLNVGRNNSWGAAERQEGAELCSRNESLTVELQREDSLLHSVTLWQWQLGTAKPSLGRGNRCSMCLWRQHWSPGECNFGAWPLETPAFSQHCKLLEILIPKSLQSESKEDRGSSKETRTRQI